MRLIVTIALALVVTLLTAASPAWCDPPAGAGALRPVAAVVPAPAPAGAASAKDKADHRLRAALHRRIDSVRALGDRLFKRAQKDFPAFCRDWESKLRARERNNVQHINWQQRNGGQTGVYVGYGVVKSCECKQSSKGIPVGKLSYQEFQYELDGKTLDEAQHATPKEEGITNTTEIFRYDKKLNKWIY